MATTTPDRIVTLDIVRGIAVMGILAMNIVAFAMPPIAYFNPLSFGMEGPADLASWAFSFIFVEGKMRGFFSFLFGASLAIVAEAATRNGKSALGVVAARQFWLFVIGALHFVFLWWGDILHHYAIVGMIAFLFRNKSVKALVGIGIALIVFQFLLSGTMTAGILAMAAAVQQPDAPADLIQSWNEATAMFAKPTAEELADVKATHLGPYWGIVDFHTGPKLTASLFFLALYAGETLAYMLFGMAALKSGFLTGAWDNARYRKWAAVGLAIAVPIMGFFAWQIYSNGFRPQEAFLYSMTLTIALRPPMIVAYAALVILFTRRGGWLVDRIAAAGRAAFTNYLGTSVVMTFIFFGWGLGLYGRLSRVELWIPVLMMWALILLWSKPWLERFRYGPLEWLWRSLSRFSLQPMRKAIPA